MSSERLAADAVKHERKAKKYDKVSRIASFQVRRYYILLLVRVPTYDQAVAKRGGPPRSVRNSEDAMTDLDQASG